MKGCHYCTNTDLNHKPLTQNNSSSSLFPTSSSGSGQVLRQSSLPPPPLTRQLSFSVQEPIQPPLLSISSVSGLQEEYNCHSSQNTLELASQNEGSNIKNQPLTVNCSSVFVPQSKSSSQQSSQSLQNQPICQCQVSLYPGHPPKCCQHRHELHLPPEDELLYQRLVCHCSNIVLFQALI